MHHLQSACIRRTDPTLPWNLINCDGTEPVVSCQPTLITNLVLTSRTISNCCGTPQRLINLSYVVPIFGATGVGFFIRSSVGLQVSNFLQISTDTVTAPPHCIPQANGTFVILWSVGSVLKHCVVTPSAGGYTLSSITTVTSIISTAGFVPYFGHCPLGNGNFVVTWTTTGNVLQGAIYTNAGVIVGSVFTIDGSCGGEHHATQPCANGDFIHYCHDRANSVYKAYRCTNAGVVSWGPITPSGCGTALFTVPDAPRVHPPENRICELLVHNSLPNICLSLPNSSSYCNQFVLNGSTGALVQQCDIGNQFHDQNCHNPICPTPAGFAVCHSLAAQPNTYVSFFDFNGNPLQLNVPCDSDAHVFGNADQPTVHTYCGFSNAALCINRYAASIHGSIELRCIHVDVAGNVLGSPFNFQEYGPADCNSPFPRCDVDGSAFMCHFSTGTTQCLVTQLRVGRSSVIGVAQAAATNGEAVTIVAEGFFGLPNTQVFGPGVAFDRRNSVPLGPRGIVGAQTAILFGWV